MKKLACFLFAVLISHPLSAAEIHSGDDIVYKEKITQEDSFQGFTQINFTCGYRSDEKQVLDHSPTFRATFYSLFSKYVGMKFGIGVNLSTKRSIHYENAAEKIKELQFESGFRFQNQTKSLTPFAEMGIILISYDGLRYENDRDKSGFFITFGIEYLVEEKIGLEMSFRQILNNVPEHTVFTPPVNGDLFYYPSDNDPFFNPASFNFGINLKFK